MESTPNGANEMTTESTTLTLTLNAYYTTEYTGYRVPVGSPQAFLFEALVPTVEVAESWRDRFPKGCKTRAIVITMEDRSVKGLVRMDARLVPDGVNAGVNETGVKRYRAIVKAAAKLGVEIEYVANAGNSYPTREAFEAAIGIAPEPEPETAPEGTVVELDGERVEIVEIGTATIAGMRLWSPEEVEKLYRRGLMTDAEFDLHELVSLGESFEYVGAPVHILGAFPEIAADFRVYVARWDVDPDLVREPVGEGTDFQTPARPYRSQYDGRYYPDRIDATRRMLEVETGEPASRVAAEIWIDREDDAQNSIEEFETPTPDPEPEPSAAAGPELRYYVAPVDGGIFEIRDRTRPDGDNFVATYFNRDAADRAADRWNATANGVPYVPERRGLMSDDPAERSAARHRVGTAEVRAIRRTRPSTGYVCPRAGCENHGGRLDWCQTHDVKLVRDRRPARERAESPATVSNEPRTTGESVGVRQAVLLVDPELATIRDHRDEIIDWTAAPTEGPMVDSYAELARRLRTLDGYHECHSQATRVESYLERISPVPTEDAYPHDPMLDDPAYVAYQEAEAERLDRECGTQYVTGGSDPYGTYCDQPKGHYPGTPHEGPHPMLDEGRWSWGGDRGAHDVGDESFSAACNECSWVGRDCPTYDAAEEDGLAHSVEAAKAEKPDVHHTFEIRRSGRGPRVLASFREARERRGENKSSEDVDGALEPPTIPGMESTPNRGASEMSETETRTFEIGQPVVWTAPIDETEMPAGTRGTVVGLTGTATRPYRVRFHRSDLAPAETHWVDCSAFELAPQLFEVGRVYRCAKPRVGGKPNQRFLITKIKSVDHGLAQVLRSTDERRVIIGRRWVISNSRFSVNEYVVESNGPELTENWTEVEDPREPTPTAPTPETAPTIESHRAECARCRDAMSSARMCSTGRMLVSAPARRSRVRPVGGGSTGPTPEDIATAVDQLKRELESPEMAAAFAEAERFAFVHRLHTRTEAESELSTGGVVHVSPTDGQAGCVERFLTGGVVEHPKSVGGGAWAAWTRSADCRNATMLSHHTLYHLASECPFVSSDLFDPEDHYAAIERALSDPDEITPELKTAALAHVEPQPISPPLDDPRDAEPADLNSGNAAKRAAARVSYVVNLPGALDRANGNPAKRAEFVDRAIVAYLRGMDARTVESVLDRRRISNSNADPTRASLDRAYAAAAIAYPDGLWKRVALAASAAALRTAKKSHELDSARCAIAMAAGEELALAFLVFDRIPVETYRSLVAPWVDAMPALADVAGVGSDPIPQEEIDKMTTETKSKTTRQRPAKTASAAKPEPTPSAGAKRAAAGRPSKTVRIREKGTSGKFYATELTRKRALGGELFGSIVAATEYATSRGWTVVPDPDQTGAQRAAAATAGTGAATSPQATRDRETKRAERRRTGTAKRAGETPAQEPTVDETEPFIAPSDEPADTAAAQEAFAETAIGALRGDPAAIAAMGEIADSAGPDGSTTPANVLQAAKGAESRTGKRATTRTTEPIDSATAAKVEKVRQAAAGSTTTRRATRPMPTATPIETIKARAARATRTAPAAK